MIELKLDTVVKENEKYMVYIKVIKKESPDITIETFSLQYQDTADLKRKLKPKLAALEKEFVEASLLKNKISQALVELNEEVKEDVTRLDT